MYLYTCIHMHCAIKLIIISMYYLIKKKKKSFKWSTNLEIWNEFENLIIQCCIKMYQTEHAEQKTKHFLLNLDSSVLER